MILSMYWRPRIDGCLQWRITGLHISTMPATTLVAIVVFTTIHGQEVAAFMAMGMLNTAVKCRSWSRNRSLSSTELSRIFS